MVVLHTSSEGSRLSDAFVRALNSKIFCVSLSPQAAQWNPTIMAVALPREVIEIEIPDTAGLDSVPCGDDMGDTMLIGPGSIPKRR